MFSRGIQILFFIFVGVGFHCDIVPVNRSLGPSLKRRTAWPCILSLALLKKCGNSMLHHYGPKLPPRSKHSYKRHKTSSEELKLFILNSFFFFVCNVFLSPRVTVQKHAFQLKIPLKKNDGLILFSTLVFLVWKCSTLTQCHSAAAVAPAKWSHVNRSSCASLFRRQVKMPAGGTGAPLLKIIPIRKFEKLCLKLPEASLKKE